MPTRIENAGALGRPAAAGSTAPDLRSARDGVRRVRRRHTRRVAFDPNGRPRERPGLERWDQRDLRPQRVGGPDLDRDGVADLRLALAARYVGRVEEAAAVELERIGRGDARSTMSGADLDRLDSRLDRTEVAAAPGRRQREEENDSCQSSAAR